jgi:hypothetical protein
MILLALFDHTGSLTNIILSHSSLKLCKHKIFAIALKSLAVILLNKWFDYPVARLNPMRFTAVPDEKW